MAVEGEWVLSWHLTPGGNQNMAVSFGSWRTPLTLFGCYYYQAVFWDKRFGLGLLKRVRFRLARERKRERVGLTDKEYWLFLLKIWVLVPSTHISWLMAAYNSSTFIYLLGNWHMWNACIETHINKNKPLGSSCILKLVFKWKVPNLTSFLKPNHHS